MNKRHTVFIADC